MKPTPRIWISELRFSDGEAISIGKDDIVVLVGPNNAGKSATLKEATRLLKGKKLGSKVLRDITIEKVGNEAEFFDFFDAISTKHFGGNPHPHYQGHAHA